jgi:hypothetical protein
VEYVAVSPKRDAPTGYELDVWRVGIRDDVKASSLSPTERKQSLKAGVRDSFGYVYISRPSGFIVRIYARQAF